MATYKGFNSVELRKPKRSMFDLSHEKRLSTRMGRLTPIFISEALPNDTFMVNSEVMLRLAPLLAPVMHRINCFVHFFFVPNRILANWWEEFITGGRTGEETPPVPSYFTIEQMLSEGGDFLDTSSLADYLGVPNIPDADIASWGNGQALGALPFLAYQKIWMDYYRDRNFIPDDEVPFPVDEGQLGGTEFYSIRTRCWEQDYFTTSMTNTQRGFEVLMPLQGTGTVSYLPSSEVKLFDGTSDGDLEVNLGTAGHPLGASGAAAGGTVTGRIENIDEVTLTSSDVSINDFRQALALQNWQERQQLAGSRMNETIMAHFGRKTSDARLQRAEYLGGGKVTIKISEVLTTAFSSDGGQDVPPANMYGHGISFGNTNKFKYNCEEWGFVLGIMSIMPTSAYDQGLPRMFGYRGSFLDYPWSVFGHLGEQEVKKWELYFTPATATGLLATDPNFGYQSRYSDWKNIPSSNHGDMRTGQSLDYWNLTREFSSVPALGETFVTFEDALQDRIFSVGAGVDNLWCYIYNNAKVIRTLPYFGTPSNL